ncbi:MAG TPA: glutamine--tRNA ligase/YqeY domain fusion protein [Planctomycetota bacterium]|nr:glutamine--tRNA ligase/YqeY domain fusion protein [Planctomycetota bacterium]
MSIPGETEEGAAPTERRNFIQAVIDEDVAAGRNEGRVVTRFPPEPNGYLHIGHAKAICLNFAIAAEYGGKCNLRFDDTNPVREDVEYVDSMKEDISWLGFDWAGEDRYASDYFERLFEFALDLIGQGLAYVDDLDAEQTRAYRGTVTEPGRNSPHRERSVEDNLDLFRRMRAGEFADGARTLRAKIDMASPNMNLRDPVLYRIMHVHHLRTGDAWCIYPMYDWAHGQSDAIEGVTHSLCSLEFENHRALYDWCLDHLTTQHRPRQYEFARLNLTYTLTSKRKLIRLVEEGLVSGWDDPRMPTLCGLRRRGYTPASIRDFCTEIGVAKFNSTIDMVKLENSLRSELNRSAQRRMAVLRPLRVVIDNYPEGEAEEIEAVNNPEDEGAGTRKLPFSRVLYIDRDDFREDAPRKFFRLAPGREVRLRYAYCITCNEVVKDPESGEVTELRCTFDPLSARGQTADGRKVKGIIHWVSAEHAFDAEVRLYDHLFAVPDPSEVEEGSDFLSNLNPRSLQALVDCKLEPSLASAAAGETFQFERLGYFCVDNTDSVAGRPVFNRSVSLRDAWARIEKQAAQR